ncbi:glycosyltransferase [Rhodobaculum claviforme]|uniref:Colanic acid biosynthesis glycosyltransferase WcaL n=1 Tax=Rhodobaculum claviforme TaxID=1549854 RepID=A0A934TNE0_9RHOB|nr:colanic acid biosynthesis glycosyltransferase WcaL [Rhodobaculum claviforme]
MHQTQPANPAPSGGPVAYLTGQYPKMSHTFIQREIASLRALGLEVITTQVRRAAPHDITPDQQAEAAATFTILEAARNPLRVLAAHGRMLRRSPRRWASMLALAARTRPEGVRAALWQLFYFLEAGILADHLVRNGAVHLHNHFAGSSGTVAMLAAGMADIPYSFTEHGPDIFFEARRWRLDEKIARAAFVCCISDFCRSQLMLFSDPAHWDKLRIIRCGVQPQLYGTTPPRWTGGNILFIGRLAPVKGVRLLLDAFVAVHRKHPDATLTLVGDGPDMARLRARAAALGLEGAVTFRGQLGEAEVAATLGAADMLVLPSFAEGVPMVLMEAMASRLPVVATRVGGVAELVEDGVSGLLVPPGNTDALAAAIERLLADPDLGCRFGTAGRATVEARHDTLGEARRLHALLSGARAKPAA